MTKELSERFKTIPQNTVEDLEQEMHNVHHQACSIVALSDAEIQLYEARKRDIASQERLVAKCESDVTRVVEDVAKKRVLWLLGNPDGATDADRMGLRHLVSKISALFQAYMAEIDCVGAVQLHEAGDDFARYAIEIQVSFRANEAPETLSAERHSGGERSVSTMMYLISLQPLTPAPFRLVDEINQAMDPVNERRIWEQVVRAAEDPSVPQYFLVTPKLLQGLPFTDDMVVLVVFNGYWNMNQSSWDEAMAKMLGSGSDF